MMTYRSENNMFITVNSEIFIEGGVDSNFTFLTRKQHSVNQQTGDNLAAVFLAWLKSSLLKTEIGAYAFVT